MNINKKLGCLGLVAVLSGCSIPLDKQLHIGGGAGLYGVQKVVLPNKLNKTPIERCALATAVGAAKEVYDSTGRGSVEFADFAVTVGGCLLTDFIVQRFK